MKVQLDHIEAINDHIMTFWFKKPSSFSYIAGQYIEMTLPHENVDERGYKHWFTLSSSPSEDFISITTKFSDRSSSFKTTLRSLELGHEVEIAAGAMGDFVLPKQLDIPLTFVAGGIGITPMRSMVKWLVDTNEERQIQLIHSANTEVDLVFADLFKQYRPLTYTPVVTNPNTDWTGESGQLNTQRVLDLSNNFSKGNGLLYISGPEPMVEAFVRDLTPLVDKEQLVGDYFPNYSSI